MRKRGFLYLGHLTHPKKMPFPIISLEIVLGYTCFHRHVSGESKNETPYINGRIG